ncbi:MAG TPA: hypothetical protein VLC09_18615 [Polyangiaceae bacterium]|nr:hypothetical protein [Polyangiaceae bacterium]
MSSVTIARAWIGMVASSLIFVPSTLRAQMPDEPNPTSEAGESESRESGSGQAPTAVNETLPSPSVRPSPEAPAPSPEPPALEAQREETPGFIERWMPEIHGFVSQGFIKSSHNNYLANSEQGSFEFTEVGLNFTKQITDDMRVGMQLFMRDLGPLGNYKPQFDWFYLDYRFFDWLGIRAGRTKIPFGLYNETNDIDSARVPILLPQSLYPAQSRDYLLAQTGGEIYGNVSLGAAGALEYRAYGGTIFIDPVTQPTISNFHVPYVVGGRAMWQTPLDGLQAGATIQALSLNGQTALDPTAPTTLTTFRIPVRLWVASLEYALQDLLVAAEYSRWEADLVTDPPDAAPPTPTATNERMYVMASYHVASWFTPGAYYSLFFPNMSDREGRDAYQHDVALTNRFDINEHWLFKLEGHYMHGTAALDPALNGGVPLSGLAENWVVFLAKTTAYF